MTLDGWTALSVEIITIAFAPAARAASATLRVPMALVSTHSDGLISANGRCFSAAAWKTMSGCSGGQRSNPGTVANVADMSREIEVRMVDCR